MRRPGLAVVVACIAVTCTLITASVCADDVARTTFRYTPQVGDHHDSALTGKLTDLQMNGASLGVTGQVWGKVVFDVEQKDVQTGNFVMKTKFSVDKAEFSGQPRKPKEIPPAHVTLTPHGKLLKIQRPDEGESPGLGGLTLDGLPLDAIALMATSLQFPEGPVGVGEEWTVEQSQELPMVGEAKVTTVTRLTKIEGDTAFFETRSNSDIPAFEMPNPLLAGKIQVDSAKFEASSIQREFSIRKSTVTRAKGKFKVEMNADLGFGMPTPLSAEGTFDMAPPGDKKAPDKPQQAQPQTEPEPGPAPATKEDKAPPADQAKRPGLNIGPLSAYAGYLQGVATVRLALDLSRTPLPMGLAPYRALLRDGVADVDIAAHVTGPNAGLLVLGGGLKAGPIVIERKATIDAKRLAEALIATAVGLGSQ